MVSNRPESALKSIEGNAYIGRQGDRVSDEDLLSTCIYTRIYTNINTTIYAKHKG